MIRPFNGLAGLEVINYHTLSDFRVVFDEELIETLHQLAGRDERRGLGESGTGDA